MTQFVGRPIQLNFFRIALAPFVLAFALLAMLGALRAEGGIGLRNSAAI